MTKVDYTKAEKLQEQKYFDCKVDMVPASLKTTYSDLVSKNPVLVSRELIVDGRPLIGIEYAPNGDVASVYTTDLKGKRVNLENSVEHTERTSKDLISKRLDEVSKTVSREHPHTEEKSVKEKKVITPTAEKKRVTPRKMDDRLKNTKKTAERA